MSSVNPKKLKVADLKSELEARNIPVTKGLKKAELVALLTSVIEAETGQQEFSSSEAPEGDSQEPDDDSCLEDPSNLSTEGVVVDEAMAEQLLEQDPEEKPEPPAALVEEKKLEDEAPQVTMQSDPPPEEVKPDQENQSQEAETKQETEETKQETEETKQETDETEQAAENQQTEDPTPVQPDQDENVPKDVEMPEAENKVNGTEVAKEETKPDEATDEAEKTQEKPEPKPERKRRYDDRDRLNRWEDRYAPPEEEPEEEFDDTLVVLDLYNSDLNFKIARDRLSGQPLTMEGFAFLWAGARATYGVKQGKICFECKVIEEDAVKHLPSDEPHPRVVRVGWSANKSSTQLGEDELSYGYGGTGKASESCQFKDYGETFHEGDIIGCYIDLSGEDKFTISYTKNGKYLDVAFTEEKSKLGEESMFPHILCKNTSVELNFGQKEEPNFPHPEELEGFIFIASVPLEERTRGPKAPGSKKECETLMMCGLPGAGKTYWAAEKIRENLDKKYNILGTNAIMDKMRVMGVARKRNYAGRWELLIQNATHCLNRLLQIACRKRRNYILDQVMSGSIRL